MVYNSFEEELRAIRLAIYEEIKDMTPEEEVVYFNAQAEPLVKEYAWQTVSLEQMEKKAVLTH